MISVNWIVLLYEWQFNQRINIFLSVGQADSAIHLACSNDDGHGSERRFCGLSWKADPTRRVCIKQRNYYLNRTDTKLPKLQRLIRKIFVRDVRHSIAVSVRYSLFRILRSVGIYFVDVSEQPIGLIFKRFKLSFFRNVAKKSPT